MKLMRGFLALGVLFFLSSFLLAKEGKLSNEEILRYLEDSKIAEFKCEKASSIELLLLLRKKFALDEKGIFLDTKEVENTPKKDLDLHLKDVSAFDVLRVATTMNNLGFHIHDGKIKLWSGSRCPY